MDFSEIFISRLESSYALTEKDLGSDAVMSGSGMKFSLRCFDAAGLGHLFTMKMSGMLGLMKMETAVLAAEQKKIPLFNIDYIKAMGKETFITEFYNVAGDDVPGKYADAFAEIKAADSPIADYSTGPHWYDSYLMPFSYAKTGKKLTSHFLDVCAKETDLLLKMASEAEECIPEERKESTMFFAQSLLDNGGPAVNQFKKLFGPEKAAKVVREYMYGV